MKAAADTLAARLKRLRKRAGVTQAQAAAAVPELAGSAIPRVERGDQDLRLGEAEALARVLGVRPGQLAGWEPETATPRADLTPTQERVVAAASCLLEQAGLADTLIVGLRGTVTPFRRTEVLDDDERALLRDYRACDPRRRRLVLLDVGDWAHAAAQEARLGATATEGDE